METAIHRPSTRGELVNKLRKGIKCEVVSSNVEFTSICLDGWLNFQGKYKVYPSNNNGYTVFEANNRSTHKSLRYS